VRKRAGDAAAILLLLLPTAILAVRLHARGFSCGVIVNPLDVRLINYLLEWGYQHLLRGRFPGTSLWSPPFFYPTPGVLGYSDTFISSYPFYFAARLLGASPAASLIAYQLLQLALSAVVTYLCARWIGLSRLGAFLAAQCFAWGWPRYNQLAHLQFASGWFVPLFFASLHLAWRQRRPWLLALAAWTVCAAFYTSAYLAYFLILTSAAAAALVALQLHRESIDWTRALFDQIRSWGRWRAALFGAMLAAPLVLMALGAREYRLALGPDNPQDAFTYQASIWSWIRPERDGLVWNRLADAFPADPIAPWEKQFFLGWSTLACTVFVLLRRRSSDGPLPQAEMRAAAGTVLLCILLVSHFPLRPLNWPFLAALKLLPGFAAVRASGRIALVLSAITACLAAAVLDDLRRLRPFLAGIAAALVLLESSTPIPPLSDRCEAERPWKALAQPLCRLAHESGAGTFLFLPMDWISFDRIFAQVPAMTTALECGVSTINGYSGREASRIAPLLHGNASRFDCPAARRAIDEARLTSGRGAVIYLEESGPLGKPGYPASEVADCFAACLTRTTPVDVEGRRGEALSIGAARPCSSN
jgi:hypothetical protein